MTLKTASKNEYAQLRGVSRQAVYAAIRAGTIAGAVLPDGKLDVEMADQLWAANTHPTRGASGHLVKRGKNKQPDMETVISVVTGAGIDPNRPPTLVESKTLQAAYQARLAQIEYEEKSGKLVDAGKVQKDAFKTARVTRDAILAVPDRVAAQFAGMTDSFAIHAALTNELRGAIEAVTKVLADGE